LFAVQRESSGNSPDRFSLRTHLAKALFGVEVGGVVGRVEIRLRGDVDVEEEEENQEKHHF
jgi:hypothetical protein